MSFTKNIKTYYFYSVFADLLILGPILVLYLIAKGLSFTEIMVLQSIAAISVVVFEVPTGAIADKAGRKISILLGAILWAVSLSLYISGTNFLVFALAEIIFSLGATMRSGADVALIYDSLKAEDREGEFQQIEGHARGLSLYAQAVGSIIAGFVYKLNIYLPLIISIGFMITTAVIVLFLKEPPIEEKKGRYGAKYFEQIKESGMYIFKHEKIKAIIFFTMVFYIFYRAGFWYFQPYMESVNIPVEYFGLIFFIFNITAAHTSRKSHIIMDKTKPRTLTFMAYLIIVSFILLGTIKVWIGVMAILLQQVARGLYRPVITKYLNKHIPSDKRATILSFQSLITNMALAITLPLMGLLKDSSNIFTTHLILSVVMIVLVYIAGKYMNKRIGVTNREEGTIE